MYTLVVLSAEKVAQYQEVKQELLSLMETLMAQDGRGYGLVLAIVDRLRESGEAIYLDNKGKWSGRLDMMGWEIASDDDDLEKVLLAVASVMDPQAPKISDYEDESYRLDEMAFEQEERQYLESNGDRLLGILLAGMYTALAKHQD